MSQLDQLPPDQRAVLSLLVRQGRSYATVASVLGIGQDAVRDRALTALGSLGPRDTVGLQREDREDIGDYLLGQQAPADRDLTREMLEQSPGGRAWARVVRGELRPLAPDSLPDLPTEGAVPTAALPRQTGGASADPPVVAASRPRRARGRHSPIEADAPAPAGRRPRRRGPLIAAALALAGAVLAGAIVLILGVGGKGAGSGGASTVANATSSTGSAPTTSSAGAPGAGSTPAGATLPGSVSTSATATTSPRFEARIRLAPTDPSSKALAVVDIIAQGGQRAFALQGQGLAATHGFAYAVWLYRSAASAKLLGYLPLVTANGQTSVVGALSSDAARYPAMVVTRETAAHGAHPGTIVLRGALSLKT